jgi:hypothetical protein
MRIGLSINSTEFIPAWKMKPRNLDAFCLALIVQVYHVKVDAKQILEHKDLLHNYETNSEKWLRVLANAAAFVFTSGFIVPVAFIFRWLVSHNLTDPVVQYPGKPSLQIHTQQAELVTALKTKISLARGANLNATALYPIASIPEEDFSAVSTCTYCHSMDGKIGEQKLICVPPVDKTNVQTFIYTASDVQRVHGKLRDAETLFNGTAGVSTVAKMLDEIRSQLPVNGFEFKASVEMLTGPPGTGKTYMLKER